MLGINDAIIYILKTLGQLYIWVVLLRFVLQMVRAEVYNPISQFVMKATQPLLAPMRRVIPGIGGLDLAALVLALLIHMLLLSLILILKGQMPFEQMGQIILWSLVNLSSMLVRIFFFALIISVILSWVAPHSFHPAAVLVQQICEPLLAPIRRLLPDLGGIDISPIFAFIALNILNMFVIGRIAASPVLAGNVGVIVQTFL